MMTNNRWALFPYDSEDYYYPGAALRKHWDRLHRGDKEPFPSTAYLKSYYQSNPDVLERIPQFNGKFDRLAKQLQEAWRLYHKGEFQKSVELGLSLGFPGYCVANKATLVYADHLAHGRDKRLALYEETGHRAEQVRSHLPDHANSHYLRAIALGRHSQSASVIEALTHGLGSIIKDCLETTLKLEPEHAEAYMALGIYHATVIEKVGKMVARLTYGADKKESLLCFESALELAPGSPLIRIEFANALLAMFGNKRLNEATDAYVSAAEMVPADAMQRLEVERAAASLEED